MHLASCPLRTPALRPLCAALLGLLAAQPHHVGAAELVAEQIDAANAARYVLGGIDAIGGIGDWTLRNGTLCAVVSDPSHESNLATSGGALIDLGYCGRDDDQFLLLQPILNNSTSVPAPSETIRTEVNNALGLARLIVAGEFEGIAVESRYVLDLEQPARLSIETRVERTGPGLRLFGLGSVLANVHALIPFSFARGNPADARGFEHPGFRGRGRRALGKAASPVEMVVAVGSAGLEPGIAYGQKLVGASLERASGERVDVPHFFLVDDLASVLATFTRPFWVGNGRSLGLLQLLQTRFMDLSTGDRLVLSREIWVGKRADVSSVTDLLFAEAPRLVGRADDPSTVIHIDRADGSPLTQVRVDPAGRFALRLPPGEYGLRARAQGGRDLLKPFAQTNDGADLGLLAVGAPGRLRLPPGPMRLVFLGSAAPPPRTSTTTCAASPLPEMRGRRVAPPGTTYI